MNLNLQYWTDFADGAVVFPLGVAVPLVLVLFHQKRAALAWTAAVGCVWAAMLALKLGGYTLAAMVPTSPLNEVGLVTPSGHVASAASIYGGLIGLLLSRPGTLLVRTVFAALLVAILCGATRVILGEHTLAETIVGAMVGVAGAAGLAMGAGTALEWRARLPVIVTASVVMIALHGLHLSWEQAIHGVALRAIQAWQQPV